MMQYSYLAVILLSFLGMLTIDHRYKLALFFDRRRTLFTVSLGVVVFMIWDALGIGFGIFFSGQSPYMSGLYLAPEFPIEELGFLIFLCYFTLVAYRFGENKWQRI